MSEEIDRREFLAKSWKAGIVLIGAAGAWTSWDVLRPLPGSALGGVIKTVAPDEVPESSAVFIRAAQTYLTRVGDEVIALYQRCPHLGCRVAWCDSAGEFECACHGSTFNRLGEVRSGPSPRGMDRFTVAVEGEVIEVNTGDITEGPVAGTDESIDEPRRGPGCSHS